MKKGFTMLEMVMVIAVLGILSTIAIPKMIGNVEMAEVSSGLDILQTVRSAISTERNRRVVSGDFTPITTLSSGGKPFDYFNENSRGKKNKILSYPLPSCNKSGCWELVNSTGIDSKSKELYIFHYGENKTCTFFLQDNYFIGDCPILKSYL